VNALPEPLPPEQRERVAVLTVIHEGKAFSPGELYRLRDPEPDPELTHLPTLLEGLWAALGPGQPQGSRRVLARCSGAQRPFLAAWRAEVSQEEAAMLEAVGDPGEQPSAGFAMETLALCACCPVPEACALRGQCRVDQETPGLAMEEAQAGGQSATPKRAAEEALRDVSEAYQAPTPP
jgi:hypothetical protein